MADAGLDGRVALVTGGASGLGRAIVERLAAAGADVVVLTLPRAAGPGEIKHFASPGEVEEVRVAVERLGRRFVAVEGDAAVPADVERVVAEADGLGGVDVLVNNAATNCHHPVAGHDVDAWRRVIDVNLIGPFLLMRACLSGMHARRFGRIIS